MAQLITSPTVFNHDEWTLSNQRKFARAEGHAASSERLIAECGRLVAETTERTNNTQSDVDKKLGQRLKDLKFWNNEVDCKLELMRNETDDLCAYKIRIENAIGSCEKVITISKECINIRQNRYGIDLVLDGVQKELIKEVETIQGVLNILKRTDENAKEQVRLNRKMIYNLEKDISDKFSAISIDEKCADIKNNTSNIQFSSSNAKLDSRSATPGEWESFSEKNIFEAEKERQNSNYMLNVISGLLQQTANDMNKQKENVDLAFDKRIRETTKVKGELEEHLSKILVQIKDMDDNIDQLTKAIDDKEAPLKVTHTRIGNRVSRPNVELCTDSPHYKLIEESNEINQSISFLLEARNKAENAVKGLLRQKLDLEDDIQVKINSIYVDDTQCVALRSSISIQKY